MKSIISIKTGALMALVAAVVSFLPVTPANAAAYYRNFNDPGIPWTTEVVTGPNGNAQIVTGTLQNWSLVWWNNNPTYGAPQTYVSGYDGVQAFGAPTDGRYLRLNSSGAGNTVLYNTAAALQSGASTIYGDAIQSASGDYNYRGLVFNLQATVASENYYYAGVAKLGNGNTGLTIRKAVNGGTGLSFSSNVAVPLGGWDQIFAQNLDTGLAWTTGNWARLTINMSAPGVFNVNVAQWNSSNSTLGGNYTTSTIDDSAQALTGGYAGFASDQWDQIGFNNLSLNTVPEPATWALLAFSLTSVMVLRRRRA